MSVEAGKLMVITAVVALSTPLQLRFTTGLMQGIYSITKAAVVNMTKAFAKECGALGIRVNALLPGLTKTKFAGALFDNEKMYQKAMQVIP